MQSWSRDSWNGRLTAGREVGPNVRHRRVWQRVVEKGDDLVVERDGLWGAFRDPAKDR